MFDRERLAASAERLSREIVKHKHVRVLRPLFSELEPIIAAARRRKLAGPIDDIPGGYQGIEGAFDPYPDFHDAYAEFSLLATADHDLVDSTLEWAQKVRDEVEGK